jgi:hypothetical protein
VDPEHVTDLRAARQALSRQLRAYRGEYQGVMDAARVALVNRLSRAGLTVLQPEE